MDALDLNPDKYRLARALRPFSYSVALVTCGLGVVLAYQQGYGDWLRALLVMLAGVLLQAASNLANDHADVVLWKKRSGELARQVVKQIHRNFILAGVCAFIACLMGLWLVIEVGWPLLLLGVFGVVGGYFYTGEPVVYKHRGWGVPAVFLFTGVLMVSGAFYAVGGVWSNEVLWISIPVSLLASALLLSNEIRDYLDDLGHNIRTLTVRTGIKFSKRLYATVLLAVFPFSVLLFWLGELHNPLYLIIPLPFVFTPLKLLANHSGDAEMVRLPPLTGQFFMVFGVCFILAVV
ncbi:prenyltransferase [uncultured Endozoicomonas sp.]|uniref:prenyltransferase n=1 Tax=uncultured Endozoicomonas sp. TaxID=432652 RepID=UPI002610E8CE|nr:prenyltransferase [uncultured Endozoicomonas sp.]